MKKSAWLFLALVFIPLVAQTNISADDQLKPLAAPEFTLKDLQGKTWILSDFKGKVLFLNFWATWCPPCRTEITDFIEAYQTYRKKGMEIIGISLDEISPAALFSFVQRFKINYPVAFATEKILVDFEPGEYIPTTIIIDKQGKIRYKKIGVLDRETLANIFHKLIAEK